MELLQESFLAFFAAVGIAWAAWTLADLLVFSRYSRRERCIVLIPAARSAAALEEAKAP